MDAAKKNQATPDLPLLSKEQFYEKESEKIKKENPKKKFTGTEMSKKLDGAWKKYQEEQKKKVKKDKKASQKV